jgi:hypothetical protein
MMTLDDRPFEQVWSEWTPGPTLALPADLRKTYRAFDYWALDTQGVAAVWDVVFAVVAAARTMGGAQPLDESLQLVQSVLEPGAMDGQTGCDITFLVGRGNTREGVLLRLWHPLDSGAVPTVAIFGTHDAGTGGPTPSEIVMWVAPGFNERPTVTLRLEPGESDAWTGALQPGEESASQDASAIARVLRSGIWERVTGAAYVAGSFGRVMALEDRPDAFPVTQGLELGARTLDETHTYSAFPPRFDATPTL